LSRSFRICYPGGEDQLGKIFAPIGLDIEADAPMDIAVSVIAEILAVLRRRSARHLRERATIEGGTGRTELVNRLVDRLKKKPRRFRSRATRHRNWPSGVSKRACWLFRK
jgi:xanthine/CO dehydrogenase XdhC/CoxF family maturation factor